MEAPVLKATVRCLCGRTFESTDIAAAAKRFEEHRSDGSCPGAPGDPRAPEGSGW